MRPGPEMFAVAAAPKPAGSTAGGGVGGGAPPTASTESCESTGVRLFNEFTFMFVPFAFERRSPERHGATHVDALFTRVQYFFNSALPRTECAWRESDRETKKAQAGVVVPHCLARYAAGGMPRHRLKARWNAVTFAKPSRNAISLTVSERSFR